jgi:hypothetical protein
MAGGVGSKILVDEIRAFAENLDVRNFEPLSSGLGLGELSTAGGLHKNMVEDAKEPASHADNEAHAYFDIKQIADSLSWYKRFLINGIAHVIDLVVVTSITVIGIVAVGVGYNSFTGVHLGGPLLRKISSHSINYVKILIGVYAVFALYWLVLRILSGTTVGGSWKRGFFESRQSLKTQRQLMHKRTAK